MAKTRYKETTSDSFFGNSLYDQKVSRDHFLRKLNDVIDWQRFTKKLVVHFKGKGQVGQAPYNPTIILKMLLLSYLWSVSERMIEELTNDCLSVGLFLGIGANERVPDHSTLTLFKNRLIESAGSKVYEGLFDEIVRVA
jgi:IS5 family transposase